MAALEKPRRIIVMVKAGAPVDAVIEELTPLLDEGDIIIDAGNSHFPDTKRRTEACAGQRPAVHGRRGVRRRGGRAASGRASCPAATRRPTPRSRRSSPRSRPSSTARRAACTSGRTGPGHYVKMVHNGIEYADIQLIAEAYDLLTHVGGLDAPAIGKIFEEWNTGDLESFLIEITGEVLAEDRRAAPASRSST